MYGTSTIDAHDKAMMTSSIMDIARTWCNMFGKEQLKATLKDVFNLFSIGEAIKEGWKLSGNQHNLALIKNSVKLVFDIKIMTKNGVIFCSYLQREHDISAILASTSVMMSIEKANIMTGHYNEE